MVLAGGGRLSFVTVGPAGWVGGTIVAVIPAPVRRARWSSSCRFRLKVKVAADGPQLQSVNSQ